MGDFDDVTRREILNNREIGNKVCALYGINPNDVRGITINIRPAEPVEVVFLLIPHFNLGAALGLDDDKENCHGSA